MTDSSSATGVSNGYAMRRALLIVLVVGLAIRVMMVASLPLMLTNDSMEYVRSAVRMAEGRISGFSEMRTPGYPALLAISCVLFGVNGGGVLVLQHAMGLAIALCATLISGRFVRPSWAMVFGLLVATDGFLLGFAHILLSELGTAFFFMIAVTAAVYAPRRPFVCAGVVGAALAAACLTRPASQVAVPFLVLGVAMIPRISLPRRAAVVGTLAMSFSLVAGPWLGFNMSRGINGMGQGFGWAFWVSLQQQDLIDKKYPLPLEVADAYKPLTLEKGGGEALWTFAFHPTVRARPQEFLRNWAFASVRENKHEYALRVGYALAWQLNWYPSDGFIKYGQTRGFLGWVSEPNTVRPNSPPNFRNTFTIPEVEPLAMYGKGGATRGIFAWWVENYLGGIPQIPLFILALSGGLLSIWRRDWLMTGVLLSSGAIVGIHALMVFHQSRYSLPAWMAWYPLAAYPLAAAADGWRRWRMPPPTPGAPPHPEAPATLGP